METRRGYYCADVVVGEKRMDADGVSVVYRKWFQFDYTYTMRALRGRVGERCRMRRRGEESWLSWGHATDVWRKVYIHTYTHIRRAATYLSNTWPPGDGEMARRSLGKDMRTHNIKSVLELGVRANPIHQRDCEPSQHTQHPQRRKEKRKKKETACQWRSHTLPQWTMLIRRFDSARRRSNTRTLCSLFLGAVSYMYNFIFFLLDSLLHRSARSTRKYRLYSMVRVQTGAFIKR